MSTKTKYVVGSKISLGAFDAIVRKIHHNGSMTIELEDGTKITIAPVELN